MVILPSIVYNGQRYVFNPYFGALLCRNDQSDTEEENHVEAYKYVENPYLLDIPKNKNGNINSTLFAKLYANLLVFTCKYCFFLVNLLLYVRIPLYTDAREANSVFYKIFPYTQQKQLCMARAMFIATLSKRFKRHGALFIGAFLPTTQMHAWVIESGMLADIHDTIWIQYHPVFEFAWKKKSL